MSNIKEWTGADILTLAEGLSEKPYTLFFDSSRVSHPSSQWSFLCWDPVETISAKNGVIQHNGTIIDEKDVFKLLKLRLREYKFEKSDIPFTGGLAGYWGYDLGRQLEHLPEDTVDDINAPDMKERIGLFQKESVPPI